MRVSVSFSLPSVSSPSSVSPSDSSKLDSKQLCLHTVTSPLWEEGEKKDAHDTPKHLNTQRVSILSPAARDKSLKRASGISFANDLGGKYANTK